jgi:deoxyadenosine/deoxycytidine kinase
LAASLVSVIGPPAAGKTTTARWLAEAVDGRCIREDYAGNPFVAEAYLGRHDRALASQLYFLFSRVSQLARTSWPKKGTAVSDYGFCQDAVYAARSLSGAQLAIYRPLSAAAGEAVKPPDVLVCLDGPEELLLERIAARGRSYERAFSRDFLTDLRRAYAAIVAEADCPVLEVDVARVDLREDRARGRLLDQVREALP